MTGLIVVVAYALGYAAFLRPMFRFFRDDTMESFTFGASDLVACMFFGAAFCLFWPLIAIGLLFRFALAGGERDPAAIARKLGGESREQKAQRLERERQDRERYIARLESELGIGK